MIETRPFISKLPVRIPSEVNLVPRATSRASCIECKLPTPKQTKRPTPAIPLLSESDSEDEISPKAVPEAAPEAALLSPPPTTTVRPSVVTPPPPVLIKYKTVDDLIRITKDRIMTLKDKSDSDEKKRLLKRVDDLNNIKCFAESNGYIMTDIKGWLDDDPVPGQSQIDSIIFSNGTNRVEIKIRSAIEFQSKEWLFDDVALSSDRPVRRNADLCSLSYFGFIVESSQESKKADSRVYFNGFKYVSKEDGDFEQIKNKFLNQKTRPVPRAVNTKLEKLVKKLQGDEKKRVIMTKLKYILLLPHGKISGLGAPIVFDTNSSVWTMLPSYWPALQQEFLEIRLSEKGTDTITSKLKLIFSKETDDDDENENLLNALKLLQYNYNELGKPVFFKSIDVENLLDKKTITIKRQVEILKYAINAIEQPSLSEDIEDHEKDWLIMAVKHMSVFMEQIDLCCPTCKNIKDNDEQIFPQPISTTVIRVPSSLQAYQESGMDAKQYLSQKVIPQLIKVADSVYSAFGVESSGFVEDITSWKNFFLDDEFTTYSDEEDSENIEMYAKMIKLIMNRIVAIDDYYLSNDLKFQRDCLLDCLKKVSYVFLEKLNLDEYVVSKRCYVYAQLISDVEYIDFGLKSKVDLIKHENKDELYKKAKDWAKISEISDYAKNYEPTNKPKKLGMQENTNFLTVFGAVKPLYQIGFLGKLGNGKSTMVNSMLKNSSLWPSNKGVAVMHNNDTAGTTQEDNDDTDYLFESITLTIEKKEEKELSLIQSEPSEPNKNLDPLGLRTFLTKEKYKKSLFYSEKDRPTFEREETPEGCLCCKSQEIKTAQDTTWDSGYDDPPDILVVDPVGIAGSEILSQQDVYSRTASIGLATMENLMSKDWDNLLGMDPEIFTKFLARLSDSEVEKHQEIRAESKSFFIDVLIEHCLATNIIFFNNHFDGRSESQLDDKTRETLKKRKQNYKALVKHLKKGNEPMYIEGQDMDKKALQKLVASLVSPAKDIKWDVSKVKEDKDVGVEETQDRLDPVPAFKMPYPEENPTDGELPKEFTQVCKVFNGINLNNPNWYDLKYFLDKNDGDCIKDVFNPKYASHWIALIDTIFDSYDIQLKKFLFNNVGFKHTAPDSEPKHVVDSEDFSEIVDLIKDTVYFQNKFHKLNPKINLEDFVGDLKRDANNSIQSAPDLTQKKLKALFKYQEVWEQGKLDRLKADVYVNGNWYRVHASSSQRLVFTEWTFDKKRKELSNKKFFLVKEDSDYELKLIAKES